MSYEFSIFFMFLEVYILKNRVVLIYWGGFYIGR